MVTASSPQTRADLLAEKLRRCLELNSIDPNACLMKSSQGDNNTAFHLLVGSDYPEGFVMALLQVFNSLGASIRNKQGNLPLHFALSQPKIHINVAKKLLEAYPKAAGMKNQAGYVPLFLAVMRDDPSFDLCKALCQAFPDSPRSFNNTHSLPLHFLCKRRHPSIPVLKMLLRRYVGAAQVVNDFGLLPLHVIASFSADLASVRLVYEAYPPAIDLVDRQGRTCLHLAVLAVGKDQALVLAEQEAQRDELRRIRSHLDNENENQVAPGEEEDEEEEEKALGEQGRRVEGGEQGREIVCFFTTQHPRALVTFNNFQALPVDTVLEKTRPTPSASSGGGRGRKKTVKVYGLYDDPATARLLLARHHFLASRGRIPPLPTKYLPILRELNWWVRRGAVLASLALLSPGFGAKDKSKKSLTPSPSYNNILGELRLRGLLDLVRLCISFL